MGDLTLDSFNEAVENRRKEAENPQPHYSMLPEWAVDEYLKQGVIPQFVMVSSNSMRKIKSYIKDHPSKTNDGGRNGASE